MTASDSFDFKTVFLNDTPLLDTRAPTEFAAGSFPTATNVPLMSDEERAKVGTCYKHHGVETATRLGHKLVSGDVRDSRMAAWIDYVGKHPDGFLYCARGGLRSHTVQEWLKAAGHDYRLVPGGFKAIRRFLIDALIAETEQRDFVVLSGRTGTGKTRILHQLGSVLDLEGHANHRGSSFGRHVTPQPTQIGFEHALTIDLLKNPQRQVFVEDESQVIGAVHLPDCLHHRLQQSPIVVIEQSMTKRVDNVLQDYVIELSGEYTDAMGAMTGFDTYSAAMLSAIDRVKKRLGGLLWQEIRTDLEVALDLHKHSGVIESHRIWIEKLLTHYYDRMYDYQLSRKQDRVLGTVSEDTVDLAKHVSAFAPTAS